ncbi:MAG: hypothetical protein NTX93_02945 [Bacteroidia bacterium]|nr:hypothetical protein [Bacteroidia bacterium]
MISKILTVLVISFLSVVAVSGQDSAKKTNPVGTWKFEAPYAPEGYTSGTIAVGLDEQKYSTTMVFTGSENKLPGEKVKVANDSVSFSIYLEGQDIKVMLKIENETKMSGKAVYTEGEVPLTLTKNVDPETEVKR